MWNDVETTNDLLNFQVVADTAAGLINDSGDSPVSIGVSGNWGAGKSSLVKMIGKSLSVTNKDSGKDLIFIEFNAWLYQGYDDARIALLQSVADKLLEECENRETLVDKAISFAKRIKWLKLGRLVAPTFLGAVTGGTLGGPVGVLLGAVGGLVNTQGTISDEDIGKVKDAYLQLQPELNGLLAEKETSSLPKEISKLREEFESILKELNVYLVLLVDDLDRCLPKTAISTLEAMRLLLFIPRTTFIIAADEDMIRNAVRSHFGNANITDELVTSYFDKLIQIPLKVPRLGIAEVKAYLMLLFAELEVRKGVISIETMEKARDQILDGVRESWSKQFDQKVLIAAFGGDASKIIERIELADQLAPIMATADNIAGNPRLIKRFLNNLIIRNNIAKAQGMTLSFDVLVKMLLFERIASPAAFEFLAQKVFESTDGCLEFIKDIEESLAKGEDYTFPDKSWDNDFLLDWLKIKPELKETDLRPFLYLSRDRSISLASYDELSKQAQNILQALLEADDVEKILVEQLKTIGEVESEKILTRLKNKARVAQFDLASIKRSLNIPKAFPRLSSSYVRFLAEIPAKSRKAPLVPLIKDEEWAQPILKEWELDQASPKSVKTAIKSALGGK